MLGVALISHVKWHPVGIHVEEWKEPIKFAVCAAMGVTVVMIRDRAPHLCPSDMGTPVWPSRAAENILQVCCMNSQVHDVPRGNISATLPDKGVLSAHNKKM